MKTILIRHAQSYKNLNDIHGGNGGSLTPGGIEQAHLLAGLFDFFTMGNASVFSPENIQCVETAEIIAKKLGQPVKFTKDLKPLNLGVLHGKTNEYAKKNHPEAYKSMQSWRKGEIDIKQLDIPQMENVNDFWARGQKVLKQATDPRTNIIVCTNSLFILLSHIMLGNDPKKGNDYKHIDVDNCDMIAFKHNKGKYTPVPLLTADSLKHLFNKKSTFKSPCKEGLKVFNQQMFNHVSNTLDNIKKDQDAYANKGALKQVAIDTVGALITAAVNGVETAVCTAYDNHINK